MGSLLEQSLPRTPSQPKTSIISVNPVILSNLSSCLRALRALRGEIIPEISVNPWLIKDLRSTKDYVRKNKLFLQNEPKFRKVKLNVNKVITRDYDRMDTWSIRKNEPKTNPNEPKTNPILAQKTTQRTQTNPKQSQSPRPCCGKPPCIPGEDTLQKPGCIFKIFSYIDDQWNPTSPASFTNFNGWISIFSFHSGGLLNLPIHDKIITGGPSWEHCGC